MIQLIRGDGLGGEGLHYIPKIHKRTLIFLHGLGDTAHGWVDFVKMLGRQQNNVFKEIKYILPTAPTRPVTFNRGMPMPAWADLRSLKKDTPEDEVGYMESMQRIQKLIDNEISNGISPHNIILGGFSQGAAMSYLALDEMKVSLACIVVLSGWLPFALLRPNRYAHLPTSSFNVPILHCHGMDDTMVPVKYGSSSVDILKKNGFSNVMFKSYSRLGHSLSSEEIDDIIRFVESVFDHK